jgi:hypothetical protein
MAGAAMAGIALIGTVTAQVVVLHMHTGGSTRLLASTLSSTLYSLHMHSHCSSHGWGTPALPALSCHPFTAAPGVPIPSALPALSRGRRKGSRASGRRQTAGGRRQTAGGRRQAAGGKRQAASLTNR